MGTRAIIKVEGLNLVQLYKHFDGYKSATLPWLEKFNVQFAQERGDDPEYRFAQLIRSSAFDTAEFDLDPSRTTGWGVVPYGSDYGQEFEYTLLKNGSVEVLEVYTKIKSITVPSDCELLVPYIVANKPQNKDERYWKGKEGVEVSFHYQFVSLDTDAFLYKGIVKKVDEKGVTVYKPKEEEK